MQSHCNLTNVNGFAKLDTVYNEAQKMRQKGKTLTFDTQAKCSWLQKKSFSFKLSISKSFPVYFSSFFFFFLILNMLSIKGKIVAFVFLSL